MFRYVKKDREIVTFFIPLSESKKTEHNNTKKKTPIERNNHKHIDKQQQQKKKIKIKHVNCYT